MIWPDTALRRAWRGPQAGPPQTPSAPEPPAARPPEPPSHPSRLQRASGSHCFLICVTRFCLRRLSSAEPAAEPGLATLQASTSSTSSQARGSAHRGSFHLFWKEVSPWATQTCLESQSFGFQEVQLGPVTKFCLVTAPLQGGMWVPALCV